MYHSNRWVSLLAQFRTTFLEVYALPTTSPFVTSLQAGLSTFKLPSCMPLTSPTDYAFGTTLVDSTGRSTSRVNEIELGRSLTFNPWPSEIEPDFPVSNSLPNISQTRFTIPLSSSLSSNAIPGPATVQNGSTAQGTTMSSFNRSCPTCEVNLNGLARELPFSRNVNSVLVCRISGRVMDDSEEGSPMAFPNGFVYSLGVSSPSSPPFGLFSKSGFWS